MLALTDATAAVFAAGVGAAIALTTTLMERLLRQKPPWHDELLAAASEFLAEAKSLQSLAVRLDVDYDQVHHRIIGEERPQAIRTVEQHLFRLRALYQKLVILGSYDAQRHGRDAIEHAWRTIDVHGYGQEDVRRPEWGGDRPPEKRLEDSLEELAVGSALNYQRTTRQGDLHASDPRERARSADAPRRRSEGQEANHRHRHRSCDRAGSVELDRPDHEPT